MASKPASASVYPGPGLRVRTRIPRVPPETVDRFRGVPTPDVSDALNRLYSMSPAIRPLAGPPALVGPALTVKCYPGDNLMVHKSLDLIRPGDVLVVDTAGSRTTAVVGDLIASKALHRGAAGFVIDGLVRDLGEIETVGIPVFARDTTPVGPLHRGPGELNHPVSCGGVVVLPGDLVVADSDGVVVVRRESAAEIAGRLEARAEALAAYVAAVKRGEFSTTWVDGALEDLGCEIHE